MFFKIGVNGMSDIGAICPNGVYTSIECKTGDAVLNKEQQAFRGMVIKQNGHYFLARNIAAVVAFCETHSRGGKCNTQSMKTESGGHV